ncbi:MAG TPA: hypothetical protein VKZ59_13000 [Acidobacteriota bacterium]|nr:hypothetical protein [Acidobacteriota bacterium]
MEQGWAVVIGMTVAYIASFAGMIFAYLGYRRRKREDSQEGKK